MTLENLQKVLSALKPQASSPHTTVDHTWKDPAWVERRAEAIKIVSDEIKNKKAQQEGKIILSKEQIAQVLDVGFAIDATPQKKANEGAASSC